MWQVELTKSADGEIWFQKGWQEFVEYYSLVHGHLLVFEFHQSSCHFNVVMFDKSAVEMDYPFCSNINGDNEHDLQEQKIEETYNDDDASVEILDDILPCQKEKGKSLLPFPRLRKMIKTDNSRLCSPRREFAGMQFQVNTFFFLL